MHNKTLKEGKEKQAEIREEMARYDQADENYYITANTVLSLAQKAYEIFQSSEVAEKRQLLNFLLQNPELNGRKLVFKLKTPFDTVLQANKCSNLLRGQDPSTSSGFIPSHTNHRQSHGLYSIFLTIRYHL